MSKVTLSVLLALLVVPCGTLACHHEQHAEQDSKQAAHPTKGPHGGQLLEVGSHVAHLEVLHDEAAGKVTIHVLAADGKTPLPVKAAPQLKLSTKDGPKLIATKAGAAGGTASVFSATDDALKMHGPEGRITVEIEGKTYNPTLVHDHGQ